MRNLPTKRPSSNKIDSRFSDLAAEKHLLGVALFDQGYANHLAGLKIAPFELSMKEIRRAFFAIESMYAKGEEICTDSVGAKLNLDPGWEHDFAEAITFICPATARDCRERVRSCHRNRKEDELTKARAAGAIELGDFLKGLADLERSSWNTDSQTQALDERRITLQSPPPNPPPVFKLLNQKISSSGNLTVVAAQAKAGKTGLIGGMLAAIMAADIDQDGVDCLGFQSRKSEGKAVVFIDSEQSPHDAYMIARRAVERAGCDDLPTNFRGFALLDISTMGRRELLDIELSRAAKVCGGIFAIIIDGVADLCVNVNDPAEAGELRQHLITLAVKYECPVIVVLHENPGSDFGKTRGHLGSELERKAESNLRLTKDAAGVTTLFSERGCRHADIPKSAGVRFAWNDERERHETIATESAESKREDDRPAAEAIFADHVGSMSWSQVMDAMWTKLKTKGKTSERRLKTFLESGLIRKLERGGYEYVR